MSTVTQIQDWFKELNLDTKKVYHNLTADELHQHTLDANLGEECDLGALVVKTGKFTGRSPKDRFIVESASNKDKIWWGEINQAVSKEVFDGLKTKVVKHLSGLDHIYVKDAQVGCDEHHRFDLRVVSELPWSSLFAHNMFIRLGNEVVDFDPSWTILNAPAFEADPAVDGVPRPNFSILNLEEKTILIGGSGYTGEIKKGVFSALNYIYPTEFNTFPMHASGNVGKEGDTAIFFGLSGTGKTTLSTDPNRGLLGDDELGWTPEGRVFNFEGGCYAKAINLSAEKEPDIYNAIRKGALVENIVFKEGTKTIDFDDDSITPNTRVSYPIEHINNLHPEGVSDNVKNIFFLTADAFGVIPPISQLTPEQAAYYFVSGFTSKLAGTEVGINTPVPSFSACFGAPFMPLHPFEYAKMLIDKMSEFNTKVWLINTGWTGGAYGTGSRIRLKYTRAMITAALNHKLDNVEYKAHRVFNVSVPQECEGVPTEILNPRTQWEDKEAYDKQANELADAFRNNFKKFEDQREGNDWIEKGQL